MSTPSVVQLERTQTAVPQCLVVFGTLCHDLHYESYYRELSILLFSSPLIFT